MRGEGRGWQAERAGQRQCHGGRCLPTEAVREVQVARPCPLQADSDEEYKRRQEYRKIRYFIEKERGGNLPKKIEKRRVRE